MDDLTLIFSHHNNGEKSRKRLHEEDDLSCIISFNTQQYSDKRCHFLTYPPIRDANNSISFSKINNNNIGAKFGGKRRGKQAHEHLLAERNRRKKISELFGSLASLLPGLNKVTYFFIILQIHFVNLFVFFYLNCWIFFKNKLIKRFFL